jgi:hypothetical protein
MPKKHFVIILLISLILGWQLLLPGYFTMHDDLQVMRLYEMNRCFLDGQIPCRWAPDMGQNYGQPLFNFYSAFPYYLGQLIHQLGFTFIDTVKLLFLISLFLSGVFSYLLGKIFVSKNAALIVAVAYLVVPYHAVDIFVRGALSESWGLTLVPLVLYCLFRLSRLPNSGNSLLFAISLAALLTTHNITTLISLPVFLILGGYALFISRNRKSFLLFLSPALLLGIGLSGFFLFPVLLEKPLIQSSFLITDYFDFRAHFTTLYQLFGKASFGYGPSRFRSFEFPQTLSFFVGILPILSLITTPIILFFKRQDKKSFSLILITYLLCLLTLFMTHPRSVGIWEKLPLLSYVQFPWRFLGPAALSSSLLIGFNLEFILTKIRRSFLVTTLVIFFLVSTGIFYFRFEKYIPSLTDKVKLSGAAYDQQIRGALLDYLPLASKIIPDSKASPIPLIKSGLVNTNYFDHRSNYFGSEFDVYDDSALIQFPITFFPGWTLYQNRAGSPIAFDIDNDFGLITVNLTKGHHLIQGFFEDTPVRRFANLTTAASAILLTLWFIISNQSKDEK